MLHQVRSRAAGQAGRDEGSTQGRLVPIHQSGEGADGKFLAQRMHGLGAPRAGHHQLGEPVERQEQGRFLFCGFPEGQFPGRLETGLHVFQVAGIVAPADGIILRRSAEPGDVVQPGQTLLVLARDGRTRLVVQVDENNLAHLAVGQLATASADAFAGQRFAAKVLSIAPSIDADRGTIEVKLEVPEPPTYLRPDMTVSVDIEVARRENVIALPLDALRDGSTTAPWVLVLEQRRAVRRPVAIGARTTDQVEIREGLTPGELVIVPGADVVAPGDRVRPKPAGGR